MIEHEIIPLFGLLWWTTNTITVAVGFLILYKVRNLSNPRKDDVGKIIGVLLLVNFLFTQGYIIYLGLWDIQSTLPLQMCGLSAILSGVVLLWRNQTAYEFLYYWGIPGAFHSLMTPEFTLGTQGWLLPDYYISHGGIILAALYLTLVLGFNPRRGSWWRIALWSQIPIALIGVLDWLINANYMYLRQKPIVENPFIIGEWPWYILLLELAGLLHFIIIYLPFGFKYRKGSA